MGVKIGINQIKRDMFIVVDGQPYKVLGYEHVKPGKGQAFVRVKAKNMRTGNVNEITYKSSDSIELADFEQKQMAYSYFDGSSYWFIDATTGDMIPVDANIIGDDAKFLKEGMEVWIYLDKNQPIGIELPKAAVYEVVHTEPGFKGDTATNTLKPATLDTGAEIQVPLFINIGDKVKVDLRDKRYIERVNE
ncbi:elongation factor P [Hydrogenothermus marinus]|uniref:Elongation factor P n=1 Tax=Hydrogenothermus marinus TaxID=133270 RepID=A0A3M0BMY9_9AQUI|nr:elongation factor P [Hydrogenothermus marinus]RMA97896.1 elongation factor P [Hydrogenothermus marinus]